MTTQTVSKLLLSREEFNHDFMRDWCETCAQHGGSFSIETRYFDSWYTIYTINWPDGLKIPAAAQEGGA